MAEPNAENVPVPRYTLVHILSCYWADPEVEADVQMMCDLAKLVGFPLPPEFQDVQEQSDVCPHCGGRGEVNEGSYYEPEVLPCSLCEGDGEIPSGAKIVREPILGLPVLRTRSVSSGVE